MPQLNALTHGLTASSPLNPDEAAAYDRAVDAWANELGSCCEVEMALIRRAAISSVRLDRCARAEMAALALSARDAERDLLATRRRAARKTAQSLAKRPRPTVDALRSTPEGCDWLIARWLDIDAHLEHGLAPDDDTASRILLLTGRPGVQPGPDAPATALALWWLVDASRPQTPARLEQARLAGLVPPDDLPATPALARASLRQFISNVLDDLHSARDAALSRLAHLRSAESQAAAAASLLDTSETGVLRRRYERESTQTFSKSISLLLRIRTDRRQADSQARREARSSSPSSCTPAFSPRNDFPAASPAHDTTHAPDESWAPLTPSPEPPAPQRTAPDPSSSPAPSAPNFPPVLDPAASPPTVFPSSSAYP